MLFKNFKIQTKKGEFVKFKPNKAQIHYYNNQTNRDLILKARQLGFSTLIKLIDLYTILTKKDQNCITIADNVDNSINMLAKLTLAWESLPLELKTIYDERYKSKNQIYLNAMRSGVQVTTSARSSTVQRLHISEYAKFKPSEVTEIITGSLPAVSSDGYIVIESTARGNNHFKDMWDGAVAGHNEYKPHFYNWAWEDSYQANPSGSTWKQDYRTLAKEYELIVDIDKLLNLTDTQFYWYYIQALNYKAMVKQEYPSIAEEAFMSTGNTVFDMSKVAQIVPKIPKRKFDGVLDIHHEPQKDHSYIIGIDTAEGVGGDSTGIFILDSTDNKEVACFQSKTIEPHETATLASKVGKFYNYAFIIPERNSSGLTTVTKLRELGYSKLFRNRSVDKITNKTTNEWGWRTKSSNRDLMIDEFLEAFHEGEIEINSHQLLTELKTFVRKENGKREHEDGKHDDLLIAAMLAWQGKKYNQSYKYIGNY